MAVRLHEIRDKLQEMNDYLHYLDKRVEVLHTEILALRRQHKNSLSLIGIFILVLEIIFKVV